MATKAQLRTIVRNLIGDSNKLVWHDPLLDVVIGSVYDELWQELMEAAPFYTSEFAELTTFTAPGYYAVSGLTKRLYKVQALVREQYIYTPANMRDIVIQDNAALVAPNHTYIIIGGQLWMFPLDTATSVELRYSYLPTAYITSAETAAITWPDGYDSALWLSLAGRIGKGDDAAKNLALGEAALARAKQALARQHLDPAVMFLTGSALEWGDG